jgi:hypothetical protein
MGFLPWTSIGAGCFMFFILERFAAIALHYSPSSVSYSVLQFILPASSNQVAEKLQNEESLAVRWNMSQFIQLYSRKCRTTDQHRSK